MLDHRCDHGPVERRLDHFSLRAPVFTFACHDAVTEEDPDALDTDALDVVCMVGDKHMLRMIGMRKHKEMPLQRGRVHAECVAMDREQGYEFAERVLGKSDVELIRRKGGIGGAHSCCC